MVYYLIPSIINNVGDLKYISLEMFVAPILDLEEF